ncbi:hypothetical protein IV505_14885 [Pseudomonas fulva]|nr:hypothetical protein [Pseudomonas fulva]MBF8781000.1 hypothetical protein [Pseudomonas fulva]
MNAATIFYLVTALLGFGLMVAGVFILAGTGWALITAAISLFCIAAFVRRGLVGG